MLGPSLRMRKKKRVPPPLGAAVVIGALRVKSCSVQLHLIKIIKGKHLFQLIKVWYLSHIGNVIL